MEYVYHKICFLCFFMSFTDFTKAIIGNTCISTKNCSDVNNSQCLGSVCRCNPGYSLQNVSSCTVIQFRLQPFDVEASDGIVEMFYNGTWAAIDIVLNSNNNYTDFTAQALCNSIGFGYIGFVTSSRYHQYSANSTWIWTRNFTCMSNFSFAVDCVREDYIHLQYANLSTILHCYKFEVTDVRLAGGIVPSEGRLEVRISERWGAVQGGYFDFMKDPFDDLICRTLGYVGESFLLPKDQGNVYAIMTIISCPVIESVWNITRACTFMKGGAGPQTETIRCEAVRRVDGSSALEGRVEAGLFGQLHTVCGLGFDSFAANVTCTALGYSGYNSYNVKTVHGTGNLTMYKKRISCNGQELSLEHCNHSAADIIACGNGDVVSVSCKGGPIKLAVFTEAKPYEGYVKEYRYGQWFDILFTVSETTTRKLCSLSGFGYVGFSAISRGRRPRNWYRRNLVCLGNETYIGGCDGEYGQCPGDRAPCYPEADVALYCSEYEVTHIDEILGVLQLTVNNETWYVCKETFDLRLAEDVCRILGHTGYTKVWSSPRQQNETGTIGYLTCSRGALTISECNVTHPVKFSGYPEAYLCSEKIGLSCKTECLQGFFGPQCSQCLCNATNTQACHNVTGVCTCRKGWTGTDCSEDLDECQIGAENCSAPLICSNTAGSYYCRCPVGMYKDHSDGGLCNVCSNNTFGLDCQATCSCNANNVIASDQICDPESGRCNCLSAWTGQACDTDVNECTSSINICQENNTECVNEDGSYRCDCVAGFKRANDTCVESQSNSPTQMNGDGSQTMVIIIASCVAGGVFVLLAIVIIVMCVRRQKAASASQKRPSENAMSCKESTKEKLASHREEIGSTPSSGEYHTLDDLKRSDRNYSEMKHDNVKNEGYEGLRERINDNYAKLGDKNTAMNRKSVEEPYYLRVQPDTDESKYVSGGYLKPIGRRKETSGLPGNVDKTSGDYLALQNKYRSGCTDGYTSINGSNQI